MTPEEGGQSQTAWDEFGAIARAYIITVRFSLGLGGRGTHAHINTVSK